MLLVDSDTGLAHALDAIFADRLAILAGAGLSMAPPSNLPSAWTIAQRAKQKYDAQFGVTRPPLSDQIEHQAEFFFQRNELATVYFSSLVDRNAFAGRPNDGHHAIADFMLSHALQAVVTTNIDTLIENAGAYQFGQIEAGIGGLEVAALPPAAVPLLKIHGCRHIDLANTVWAPGQLTQNPVRDRIANSVPWLTQRLLNRDLLIVGYWTDWDYLNNVLSQVFNAVNPTRVIVVDPAASAVFQVKAPALYALGLRAADFLHVRESGADFLAKLRREFSKSFVRQVLQAGAADFQTCKGVVPNPGWLDPPQLENEEYWLMRRDLLGCEPNSPANSSRPPAEPLLGLTLIELQAAGAVPDGANWKLGGSAIRVLRTPNQTLNGVEEMYKGDLAPAVAPNIVIAVGAHSIGLPSSIVRGARSSSIVRSAGCRWMTYPDAVRELGI